MLTNLKFPLLYAVEVLLWLPLLATFYGAISFVAAKPVASLDLQGKSLPAGWEAAVPTHGKFLQGHLVSSHPVAFASIIAVLLASAFLLYRVHRAQAAQRQAAGLVGARAHTIAHGCVFAILAVLGYVLVTRVLVGVSAA
jgi:hypothetical protein